MHASFSCLALAASLLLAVALPAQDIRWVTTQKTHHLAVKYCFAMPADQGHQVINDFTAAERKQTLWHLDASGELRAEQIVGKTQEDKPIQVVDVVQTQAGSFALGRYPFKPHYLNGRAYFTKAYGFELGPDGGLLPGGRMLFQHPDRKTGEEGLIRSGSPTRRPGWRQVDLAEYVVSPSGSHVAYVSRAQAWADEGAVQPCVVDVALMDASLNLTGQHEVTLPYLDAQAEVQHAAVDHTGAVLLAVAVWEDAQAKDGYYGNQTYWVYRVEGGTIVQSWHVDHPDWIAAQAKLVWHQDHWWVAGLYRNRGEYSPNVHGLFRAVLGEDDKVGEPRGLPLSREVEASLNKEKDRAPGIGAPQMELAEVWVDQVRDRIHLVAMQSGVNYRSKYRESGDITYQSTVAVPTGKDVLHASIPTYATGESTLTQMDRYVQGLPSMDHLCGYVSMFVPETGCTYFLFDDKPSKDERYDHGKEPLADLVGVGPDGDIFYWEPLVASGVKIIPQLSHYAGGGELMVVGAKGRRNLKSGLMTLPVP